MEGRVLSRYAQRAEIFQQNRPGKHNPALAGLVQSIPSCCHSVLVVFHIESDPLASPERRFQAIESRRPTLRTTDPRITPKRQAWAGWSPFIRSACCPMISSSLSRMSSFIAPPAWHRLQRSRTVQRPAPAGYQTSRSKMNRTFGLGMMKNHHRMWLSVRVSLYPPVAVDSIWRLISFSDPQPPHQPHHLLLTKYRKFDAMKLPRRHGFGSSPPPNPTIDEGARTNPCSNCWALAANRRKCT